MHDFKVAISQAPLLCLAHRYVLYSLRPHGLQHVKASLSITNFQSLLKLMSVESVMSSIHLVLCCPLLLPSIFPSIRIFSNELVFHIRWPKYWNFSISPSNEYLRLISFRVYWLNLFEVHGRSQTVEHN